MCRSSRETGYPIVRCFADPDYEVADAVPPYLHAMLQERDDRIAALEARVSQLSTSLVRLREDVVGLARATDRPDVVAQAPVFDTSHASAPTRSTGIVSAPNASPNYTTPRASSPYGRPQTRGRTPVTHTPETPYMSVPRRLDTGDSRALSPFRVPTADATDRSAPPLRLVGSLSPISDAVVQMLQASGADVRPTPGDEQATVDDPVSLLLTAALRKYHVREDYRSFALFVHYHTTDRCLSYEEKPLVVAHQLREAGHQPYFSVRRLKDIESPVTLAEKKLELRRREAGRALKNEAMRARASLVDLEEPVSTTHVYSVSHFLSWPELSGGLGEQAVRNARLMGPAAGLQKTPPHTYTYALAIYPYESEREDEFDVQAGDAFIVLAKAKGWWALRRDSVADGQGDIYFPKDVARPGQPPYLEIWTGWVPAGCLLETSRPVADLLFAQAGGLISPAASIARSALTAGPSTPTKTLRYELVHAPIPLSIVLSSGTFGTMLADFEAPDGQLRVQANERLRVFKRHNHWSYCIVDGPSPARGWIPSWCTSLD